MDKNQIQINNLLETRQGEERLRCTDMEPAEPNKFCGPERFPCRVASRRAKVMKRRRSDRFAKAYGFY